MKKLMFITAFLSALAIAQEMPSVEFVKEALEYCVEYAESESNKDEVTLICVNEELEESDYKPFSSLKDVKAYING